MDRRERFVLLASAVLMLGFLAALSYAAVGLGLSVPTCVSGVAPFASGRVIDHGGQRYEVHLVAKMWAFDPPEIRLPTGADVDLYVSALDVTHGVYIEHTGVNLMAVPGAVNATRVRFDTPGTYAMLCHEYCGVGHQNMAGRIIVGAPPPGPAAPAGGTAGSGAALFAQNACDACHSRDGSPGVGPTLKGVLGRRETLADGSALVVDEAFIREQLRAPNSKPLQGFQPVMPALPLTDAEVDALVEYIKTL